MSKRNKAKRANHQSPVIGYAIVDRLSGNVATLGTACLIFGTRERAEAHKAQFHIPPIFVVEEARLSHLVACLLAGGAYAFDLEATHIWNAAIVTHHERYIKPFSDNFGFIAPEALIPPEGSFSSLQWIANPLIHEVAQEFISNKAAEHAANN